MARNRILLFFLLGCLFAWTPYRQYSLEQQRCAQQQGVGQALDGSTLYNTSDVGCLDRAPMSLWARGSGILSVICFAAFFFFFVKAILARRRERILLEQAGVRVNEADLPLDE